jgi:Kef-type K+ transport system membrane component KefB
MVPGRPVQAQRRGVRVDLQGARLAPLSVAVLSAPAFASTLHDPSGPVLLSLAVMLLGAKVGGDAMLRVGLPAVLGELLVGVALGNLGLVGVHTFEPLRSDAFVDLLSRVGVVILLFEVGLESTVSQMLAVGRSALGVALLGVATPFALGWAVAALVLPNDSSSAHAFIAASLTATSVGITARVFQELGREKSTEARIILGAAVIDDVLGLVILAVVSGAAAAADVGGDFPLADAARSLVSAVAFLGTALVLGRYLPPTLFGFAAKLKGRRVLVAFGLIFCFTLAWAADLIGLSPIVGAFAAGLVLEDVHTHDLASRERQGLEHLVEPISDFLVPIFFVVMGLRTDLSMLAQGSVWLLTFALVAVAVVGKAVAGLGVFGGGVDRLSVGLGMMPRGEVGLIFAGVGSTLTVKGQPVIDARLYAAIVLMVIVTTVVTPPALAWSLKRKAAVPKAA